MKKIHPEILTAPINQNDPIPVNQARDMYAACMDTGWYLTIFIFINIIILEIL